MAQTPKPAITAPRTARRIRTAWKLVGDSSRSSRLLRSEMMPLPLACQVRKAMSAPMSKHRTPLGADMAGLSAVGHSAFAARAFADIIGAPGSFANFIGDGLRDALDPKDR